MNLVIGVDVDGVCANLMPEWLRRYNAEFGDALTPDDITEWNIRKFVKPEAKTRIFDYLHDSDLYERVEPIDGALEGVRKIRANGNRVVFVTSAVTGHAGQKLLWLRRHGFLSCSNPYPCRDYFEATDKALLNLHYLIDDRLTTVQEFWDQARSAFLFPSPATASHRDFWTGWAEIPVLIQEVQFPRY